MNNSKMFYKPGKDNTEFYNLLSALRNSPKFKYIPELSNNWFYVYQVELEGISYKITEDIENGIPYSIEILN